MLLLINCSLAFSIIFKEECRSMSGISVLSFRRLMLLTINGREAAVLSKGYLC